MACCRAGACRMFLSAVSCVRGECLRDKGSPTLPQGIAACAEFGLFPIVFLKIWRLQRLLANPPLTFRAGAFVSHLRGLLLLSSPLPIFRNRAFGSLRREPHGQGSGAGAAAGEEGHRRKGPQWGPGVTRRTAEGLAGVVPLQTRHFQLPVLTSCPPGAFSTV